MDVITGFPGESHDDFLDTYKFLLDLDVSYLHVFTYSERPNTAAAEMPDPVPLEERRQRTLQLNILSDKKRKAFYAAHSGTERPVLFEAHKDSTLLSGFTDNYIKVEVTWEEGLINTIRPVRLTGVVPE